MARLLHERFQKTVSSLNAALASRLAASIMAGIRLPKAPGGCAPAAACSGLDQYRILDFFGHIERSSSGSGSSVPAITGSRPCVKNAGRPVCHPSWKPFQARADEGETLFFDAPGKLGVFGQEAIARMNGGGAA